MASGMKEEGDTPAKRKKRGLLPLSEKMGLDKTSEYMTPVPSRPSPLTQPGMFPNAADATLEDNSEDVGEKMRSKFKNRRGA